MGTSILPVSKRVWVRSSEKVRQCCQAVARLYASLEYSPTLLSSASFPPQCALAADQVVFTQKELELEELRRQMQLMAQESKGHAVSLKEAQKVNRLQVRPVHAAQTMSWCFTMAPCRWTAPDTGSPIPLVCVCIFCL